MAGTAVMLAEKWEGQDPTGWWMSEKLDGMRAWWDGERFYSRQGHVFHAPDWFREGLPRGVVLDGELWCGRGQFREVVSIVKNSKRQDDWKFVTYLVFDAPKIKGDFEARMGFLRTVLGDPKKTPSARIVGHVVCKSMDHLTKTLAHVEDLGGEGLMLRKPHSAYVHSRCDSLLKVKTFCDEEAIVVGYKRGQGRNQYRMGHLVCRTPDGREFSVGGGFTDAQRDKPPKIGSVITYKYFELSPALKPRFPIFVGVRHDIKWEEYCASYKKPEKKKAAALKRSHTLLFSDVSQVAGAAGAALPAPSAAAAAPAPAPAPASADDAKKPPCKYGAACFRRNAEHLAKYSHPAARDADAVQYVPVDAAVAPPPDPTGSFALDSPHVSDDEADPFDDPFDEDYVEPKKKTKKPTKKDEEDDDDAPPAKKAKKPSGDDEDARPMCKYGAACFRKNAEHLAKYRHPPRDEAVVAVAAAAGLPPPPMDAGATQVFAEITAGGSLPKLARVCLVDTKTGGEFELDEGKNVLGRGFADITDAHVSRNQLEVTVASPADGSGAPKITLLANGVNPSSAQVGGSWKVLPKGASMEVADGDMVSLLQDHSIAFRVAVIRA